MWLLELKIPEGSSRMWWVEKYFLYFLFVSSYTNTYNFNNINNYNKL